jgi:hypothetical protein
MTKGIVGLHGGWVKEIMGFVSTRWNLSLKNSCESVKSVKSVRAEPTIGRAMMRCSRGHSGVVRGGTTMGTDLLEPSLSDLALKSMRLPLPAGLQRHDRVQGGRQSPWLVLALPFVLKRSYKERLPIGKRRHAQPTCYRITRTSGLTVVE